MKIETSEFESFINKQLRLNQILFYVSVFISILIFIKNQNNVFWAMYFLFVGSFTLFNIQQAKQDKKMLKKGQFEKEKGILLDIFPENEKEKAWIILMQKENGKLKEFATPKKLEMKPNETYVFFYTKHTETLVYAREEITKE